MRLINWGIRDRRRIRLHWLGIGLLAYQTLRGQGYEVLS